jgi:sec-independent protein translocase protein TatA
MFGIGPAEMLVILLVALLLFGAKRLPVLARSLGRSMNEFKTGLNSTISEIDDEVKNIKSERDKPSDPKT